MWDARLLTLYKQHYMDCYDDELCSDYSCWGYYDGLDIAEVKPKQYSSLFKGSLSAPVSELWYKTGEKIGNMTGQFSSINIGLFRCMTDNEMKETEAFWKEKKKMPFFGIAFLQLDNPRDYRAISKRIEGKVTDSERVCNVVAYYTYDNADMVLLISSNSLNMIEQQLQKADIISEIRYQHSIIGVSEQYLRDCKESKKILDCWQGGKCFINDPVFRLDIRLVSSGESQIMDIQKNILDEVNSDYTIKNYEKATYSYVVGHENLLLSLEDTDVRTMLVFLLPGGFTTHQNESYTKRVDVDKNQILPKLFNIETSYTLNRNELKNVNRTIKINNHKKAVVPHNWFQHKMGEYKIKLEQALIDGDESLYSYYLALLRTLNVLVQYERFSLSEDIFYLLYPSFKMFDEKLNRALEEIYPHGDRGEYNPNMSVIKQSMCEFLESVNSVIYHTIHTDQVYLMVPGYSGTSFSIPVKLNMVFLWFTDCVARLLGNEGRNYQCILVPAMETKPATHWLKLEKEQKSFLVSVKTSQRTLYMPKALMIILAHEMGHYIGGNLRCRQLRAEKMMEVVVFYLAEMIIPKSSSDTAIVQKLRDEFEKSAKNIIWNQHLKDLEKEGYYGDKVKIALESACRILLSNCRAINKENLIAIYRGDFGIAVEQEIYQINKLLDAAETKATDALMNNTMNTIIDEELRVYKEVFSDLVAVKLLKCDKSAFDEAYRISEGIDVRGEEIERRDRVMVKLGRKIGWNDEKVDLSEADSLLHSYLTRCNEWLDKKFYDMGNEARKLLNEVRLMYRLFSQDGIKDNSVGDYEIYDLILRCIRKMKSEIDQEIEKENIANDLS